MTKDSKPDKYKTTVLRSGKHIGVNILSKEYERLLKRLRFKNLFDTPQINNQIFTFVFVEIPLVVVISNPKE